MLLELLEWLVAIVFAVFFLTQILVPMWKGVPYCPMFRTKRRELENELGGVKEEKELATLEEIIAQEREQLAQQKTSTGKTKSDAETKSEEE